MMISPPNPLGPNLLRIKRSFHSLRVWLAFFYVLCLVHEKWRKTRKFVQLKLVRKESLIELQVRTVQLGFIVFRNQLKLAPFINHLLCTHPIKASAFEVLYFYDICRSLGWLWSRWRSRGSCWSSSGWRRTLALHSTKRYRDMALSRWVHTTFGQGKMLGRSLRYYLKASPGYLKSRSSFSSIRLQISSICGSRAGAI